MRMLFQASTHDDLLQVIRSVRNRWRLRVAVRGLAIVLTAAVAAFLIASYGMDHFRFTPAAVTVFRVLTYVGLAGLFVRFLIVPLTHKLSDERVALYLEEHEPSLKGYVLSGVQFGATADGDASEPVSPALVRKLVRSAIERCMLIEEGRRVERRNLIRSSGMLAGATVTGLVFLLLNPPFLQHGVPFLLSPWSDVDARSPYSISVSPGNAAIARGSDLRISAALQNFDSDEVDLAVRIGDAGEWERWPMTTDEETGEHVILLFDLDERSEYYVEASGVRSELYRIEVSDLPYVESIALEYHYPAYTGLSPQRQEGSGDIAALRGTRVEINVVPTVSVPGGMLVVDETDTIGLTPTPEGALAGTLRVQAEGMYHVVFDAPVAGLVNGSPDYVIDVLSDLPPSVSFVKPGRDINVTSVEEVFTEVRAEDDYGVASLQLVYSVNGGPEQRVPLYAGQAARREISASHTFYLEEADLEPGDLVAYYAQAAEPDRGGARQTATTDIYFMEVRPFDREYRQAEQQGGGGGGGGEGRMDGDLSGRQRDIIAGTFRMVRDRDQYSDEEFRENLATLALAQGKLREEVETLVRRINSRRIVELDSAFQAVAEALPQAVEAMDEAEESLGERDPQTALPPEQRALQHLQRAEAAFNETQVSRGGGGGGGGGQTANAEDLADLFDLEMDKLRNQYEQVQRGRQEQMDAQLDETLQKLKELARRQQQQIDRMRAQQNSGGQAGGGAQAQRRLADEAEELARQLERLSREQSRPDLQETARSLRDAAEAMRRAAANARNNGVGQGVEALDQLREARRLLDQNRSARAQRDADDALRRVERLAEQQREVMDDVNRLSRDPQTRAEQVRRLQERKTEMAEEVAGIEAQLDETARASRAEQREAARKLQEAAKSIRDNKLREALLWSRGVIQERSPEYAQNLEEQIGSAIEELRDLVRDAAGSIGETREQRLGRSLDRTRSTVNALESLRDRLQERRLQQGQQGQEQGQEGQQGQQGQEGQQGQQGQEGQQGQQGQQGQGGQQGQQGQEQGRQGAGTPGQFAPDARGGGGPGRIQPQDPRQFSRELRERQIELQELREQLRREGVDVGDLDAVIGGLRDLDRRRDIGTPQGLEQLEAQIIQGLKEFEFNLRRALEVDAEERLTLSGSDDVPSGYRELVEEYYKSLSRGRRPN